MRLIPINKVTPATPRVETHIQNNGNEIQRILQLPKFARCQVGFMNGLSTQVQIKDIHLQENQRWKIKDLNNDLVQRSI